MKFKKIMASLGTLICLCSYSGIVAYAETTAPIINDGISLAYEIADAPKSMLRITDRTAYCISSTGGINATSITVTHTLQKHWGLWIWDDVDDATWNGQVNFNSIRLSNCKSNLDSGTYRLESVFTLTNKEGKSETVTIYSNEQVVP